MNKSAKLSGKIVTAIILGLVVLVVLFNIYAEVVPEAQTAGDSMGDEIRCAEVGCAWNTSALVTEDCAINSSPEGNATACPYEYGIPLSSLFSGTGVIFIIIMSMFVIFVVRSYLKQK